MDRVNLRPSVPAQSGRRRPARLAGSRRLLAVAGLTMVSALGGCTIPGFTSSDQSASRASADASPEPGQSWHLYSEGTRGESAGTPRNRVVTVTARPPARTPDAMTEPTSDPGPVCVNMLQLGTVNGLTAVAGVRSATVTWPNTVDTRLLSYRLATVPQQFPNGSTAPLVWQDVPRGTGCDVITVTVSGLTSGYRYVFWLDAILDTGARGVREPMIARSSVVTVG